ncbi:MAG: pyridoxal phosphate-dependent aminotransferase [Ignavibacteriaceae bacterium]
MSILEKKDIELLYDNYKRFCDSVVYREGEAFYSENNPILELSYNENPLGPGKLAKEALKHYVEYGFRYPPLEYSLLINKLAEKLNVNNDNVIVTAGSVAAIDIAVRQLADDGDKVVFSKSSMPWYRWSTIANKSIPEIIPLSKDMNHDLDSIYKAVDNKTKVIIISNPHNPTGLYISEDELKDLLLRIPETVTLIVDQAYYEYQSRQEKILIEMINEAPNLILTRTFSKLHGLAGMRIGYAITNKELIKAMKAKWLPYMPSVTTAGAYAAYHALDDWEHYEISRKFNFEIKNNLYKLCDEFNVPILHSEANFVAINVKDSLKNETLFHEQGFRLTAGYFFGYPEWVRISFISNIDLISNSLRKIFIKFG